MRILLTMLAIALGSGMVRAQPVADHLQCYKITSATLRRLRAEVDLDAPSTGLSPGCRIDRPSLYCVPASKTVQPGSARDGTMPIAEVPYHGPPAATDRICYRAVCDGDVGTAPDRQVTDGFGTHAFTRLRTEMVCTPATGGTLPPPANGFQLKGPEVEIDPYQDVNYCWYFRTPNTTTVPVKRWTSTSGPVTQQVVMFTTTTREGVPADRFPPGTLTTVDCDVFSSGYAEIAQWLYDASTPTGETAMPADDGAGHPVAMEVGPNAAGFLMIHFKNTSDQPVKATAVTINAEAVDGPVWTKASTFVSVDGTIAIPPLATNWVESTSCDVPAGARFFRLTTLAHGRAVRTAINDATTTLFESTDWAHPGAQTFAPPFLNFASPRMTHSCTYTNPFNRTVGRGTSYQTEEQCIGVGWFFPATGPRVCLSGYVF